MAKSDSGKIIALFGGLIALVAVLIGLIPSDISWWYAHESTGNQDWYLNAFGFFTDANGTEFMEDYLILVGGLIFLVGAALIMYGGIKEQKAIAIISGILMIIGLVVFCVALNANEDWENIESVLDFLNSDYTVFYGEQSILFWHFKWGLGWGFIIAAIGAGIGTIGAFMMD
jgi:amino acid transporter